MPFWSLSDLNRCHKQLYACLCKRLSTSHLNPRWRALLDIKNIHRLVSNLRLLDKDPICIATYSFSIFEGRATFKSLVCLCYYWQSFTMLSYNLVKIVRTECDRSLEYLLFTWTEYPKESMHHNYSVHSTVLESTFLQLLSKYYSINT